MRDIRVTEYCDTIKKDMSTTIPILGSFPDDLTLGTARGCRFQVEFQCNMNECPLSKSVEKVRQEYHKKSRT